MANFSGFDSAGKYSDWASGKGLQLFEDYLGKGKAFDKPMVDFLQQTSSVAPQYDAQGTVTNSGAMWNDYVARQQDRDTGTSSMIGELGIGNDRGSKLALAAAAAALGAYFGGYFPSFGEGGGTITELAGGVTETVGGGTAAAGGAATTTAGSAAPFEAAKAAETVTGASASPQAALGGGGTIETAADAGGWLGGDVGPGGVTGPQGAWTPTAGDGGGGLIQRAMDFAKANQTLTLAGAGLVSGAMGGMGQYITQNELMDKKIAADSDLLAQRAKQEQELQEWKRRFTGESGYFGAKVPFKPAANAVLRRPDGAPVFAGGLVNRAMMAGG